MPDHVGGAEVEAEGPAMREALARLAARLDPFVAASPEAAALREQIDDLVDRFY